MKPADLVPVLVLEKAIFSDAWPRQAFIQHLDEPHGGGIVVISNGDIIGYACYQIEAPQFHFTNLAVAPDWRRKSVANGMLDHILDLARENRCDLIYLEVRESNAVAREFYESAGFMNVDRSRAYYENPEEDALVMLRQVSSDGNKG